MQSAFDLWLLFILQHHTGFSLPRVCYIFWAVELVCWALMVLVTQRFVNVVVSQYWPKMVEEGKVNSFQRAMEALEHHFLPWALLMVDVWPCLWSPQIISCCVVVSCDTWRSINCFVSGAVWNVDWCPKYMCCFVSEPQKWWSNEWQFCFMSKWPPEDITQPSNCRISVGSLCV